MIDGNELIFVFIQDTASNRRVAASSVDEIDLSRWV